MQHRLITHAFVTLLVLFVVGSSACTPRQSREQYEERLTTAVTARQTATDKLESGALDSQQLYDQQSTAVTRALEELDADAPPRDAADAHERMVAGLEGLAALLSRLGRCTALGEHSDQDERACRQSIRQEVYDAIRNDFAEANTIYRAEGYVVPGLGGDEEAGDGSDTLGSGDGGEDTL